MSGLDWTRHCEDLNLDSVTKLLVVEALRRSHGKKTEAAKLLGVARSTMFAMVKKFDLSSEFGCPCCAVHSAGEP